nr:low expression of osmotically responsive genes 2 [Tanacetum cinerariifolium]
MYNLTDIRVIFRRVCIWWDVSYMALDSFDEWISWITNLRLPSKHKNVVASELYDEIDKTYDPNFKEENNNGKEKISGEQLKDLYKSFVSECRIVTIEDPFDQDDLEHYGKMTAECNEHVKIVGDDLLVTNLTVHLLIMGKMGTRLSCERKIQIESALLKSTINEPDIIIFKHRLISTY